MEEENIGRCKAESCMNKIRSIGYCSRHYHQMRKHGCILKATRFDPNKIVIHDFFSEIILFDKNQKEVGRATVDTHGLEIIKKHKWCITFYGYAVTTINGRKTSMHKLLTIDHAKGYEIDHIDGNRLNNRRGNLRIATHSENLRNAKKRKDCSSKYKGVYFCKKYKKWVARIKTSDKNNLLGIFEKETEAAKAYDFAAIKFFKEFAKTNEY